VSVTAPPRPPRQDDPVDRAELEALVEALIEEARQRARRRRRIYTASVALAAVVGLAVFMAFERTARSQTASPGLPARSSVPAAPTTPRIAFVSAPLRFGRQGDGGLYVVNADGSGKQHLTSARYSTPAWSPDGRKIAFEGGSDRAYVDVISVDGTGRERLTLTGSDTDPSWSPDGQRILFRSGRSGSADIYVMNADGSDQHYVAGDPKAGDREPVWSPDGKRFAFSSDLDDTRQVYVARADGTGLKRLTGVRRAFTSTGERCTVVGTNRADTLQGTRRDEIICGLGGNDTLRGLGGADILDGGLGNDRIVGGAGVDTLLGGAGDDLLDARDGKRDDVDGGPGRDRGRVDPKDWISLLESLL
jgi:Ca2+-binding RTX toxin-like protein